MSSTPLGPVLRHIRKLAASTSAAERTDGQLLHDFSDRHDQAAFAAIVSRHGPLVLNVCQGVLQHVQDAEDAFQATFLVLARKAASIRKGDALVSWLHGVAYRVAVNTKRNAARRRAREREAQTMPQRDPHWEMAWQEVQTLLDQEIQRLPARQQAPFILCCLEGRSRADAARQLGLKEGTVWSRLAQARKQLQQRLARRGVMLSAVLGFAALARGRCLATVPARLASTTVRAALRYAALRTAATGMASAQVVALADGLLKSMALTKLKIASVLLAAVGILAAGAAAVAQRQPASPPSEPPRAEAPASRAPGVPPPPAGADNAAGPQAQAENAAPAGLVQVSGRVLGPDGEPLAGARIHVWTSAVRNQADMPVRATTGTDGRFRLPVTQRERAHGATVVARAPGLGPDWFEVRDAGKDPDVTFRLVKDDMPIAGRIVDPQGRPIPGVTVQVRGVGQRADCGDLSSWVDRNVKESSQGRHRPEQGLQTVGVEAVNLPAAVTTGADGRFQLTGFGREKVLTLDLRGPAIEQTCLRAVTRPGPALGWIPGGGGLYAATFDYAAGPAKPIVGTVRDKATGQPLAGITVGALLNGRAAITTTTDAQGRYRLDAGKLSEYWVVAEGLPYFQATNRAADTPGFEPLAVDFTLERGLPITGRLTDKTTGQPVRGWVVYYPLPTNPYRKNYRSGFGPGTALLTRWLACAPDGSFTTLGIPGPGVLVAGANFENRYAMVDKQKELDALGIRGDRPINLIHALVRVNCPADQPATCTRDIAFDPGHTVTGSVVGPDGEPLEGGGVAGLVISSPQRLPAGTFTFTGLGSTAQRILVFQHPEKKLGAVQTVRGEDQGPLAVRLDPLGALAGRVIDGAGHPWAGLEVTAFSSLTGKYYENLPLEEFGFQGEKGYRLSLWYRLTRRQTATGPDGSFQLDGLLPGWPYQLFVSDGDLAEPDTLVWARDGLRAGPGRTTDLGDLRAETADTGERAYPLIPGKGPEGDEGRPGKRFWQIRWSHQPPELNPDTAATSETAPSTGGVMR